MVRLEYKDLESNLCYGRRGSKRNRLLLVAGLFWCLHVFTCSVNGPLLCIIELRFLGFRFLGFWAGCGNCALIHDPAHEAKQHPLSTLTIQFTSVS